MLLTHHELQVFFTHVLLRLSCQVLKRLRFRTSSWKKKAFPPAITMQWRRAGDVLAALQNVRVVAPC